MDTTAIKDKLTMMATKLGMSPETIKAMQDDSMSSSKPTASVTVVAVKKPTEEETTDDKTESECANMTDEQINKMSEQEAKDYIKKMRDSMKEEDKMDEAEPAKPTQSVAERVMNTPNFK